jgi:hypothetical protein
MNKIMCAYNILKLKETCLYKYIHTYNCQNKNKENE